ncbi:MAG: hypothetical protein A3I05_03205 [Deltaproteobacteria bacterium RIFCSPLOWO2_02_FULL_44_10]|nr:MAG: hypothetical protein A3C46_02780 [Deltaproteobacteria bacterium RIFCSPHIGHO2_02_FULL_44_16]OGQ46183.1 MAG: hypothetical protein A3I05_03205 [Deltaproteobacteria bacterium RIFCSPLOWO2_02_FULL_44_10]
MKKIHSSMCILFLFLSACGGSGSGAENKSGDCAGGGWCGTEAIVLKANVSDAQALFTTQENSSAVSSESASTRKQNGSDGVISTKSPLWAVTSSGVKEVLSATEGQLADLPKLSIIAVAGNYGLLVFEHPFIYTETANGVSIANYKDPWSPSSPFTCQVYLVSLDEENAALKCVTNQLEFNTWDSSPKSVQKDSNNRFYFPMHVPGNWKDVLLRYDPASDQVTEVINANICFREFTVTPDGAVLHTGITSTSSKCDGESSLYIVTTDGERQVISRGWWDFTFKAIENGTHSGKVLLYGPDPLQATLPEWDDACLYRYNPDASGSSRSTEIADCSIDVWRYIESDIDGNANSKATQRTRCEETKSMIGGNNKPKKILLADTDSDNVEEIYLVGAILDKKAGTWTCDICVDNGTGSCTKDGELQEHITQNACTSAGGTWSTSGGCYNGVTTSACTITIPGGWDLNHEWCEDPGSNWRSSYNALAHVNYDDDDPDARSITRLSNDNLSVDNCWTIDNIIYCSAFNATDGAFEFHKMGNTKTNNTELLNGYEMYEVIKDPRDESKLFFSALRESDNQYVTGTLNPTASDVADSVSTESGITGQIETIVVLP